MTTVPDLIAQLDRSRQDTQVALSDLDPDTLIYAESGWRLRDVIAHITAWEEELISALRARRMLADYTPPLSAKLQLDVYNDLRFRERYDRSVAQVINAWAAVRAELKASLQLFDTSELGSTMCYPWNDSGSIAHSIHDMIWHEQFHTREILVAVGREPLVVA